jgi:hypothetical protein
MTDISSFVKLSPQETVIDSWEVFYDNGKPTIGEIILGLVFCIIIVGVVRMAGGDLLFAIFGYSSVLMLLVWLLALAAPALLIVWPLFSRPPVRGQLCLTNWRLLYYSHGQGRFRSQVNVQAVSLADVLGIHTFYTEGLFGKKMLELIVYTRFEGGIKIAAGALGSLLRGVPVLGRFMVRNTLGKDAFTVLPVLYKRIRHNTGTAAAANLSY